MNPNTRIWFENGKNGDYGAVYVGFDNLYPQGGMNEAGLVFDGFTQSFKDVKNGRGKKSISALDLEKKIMRECATVEQVKNLIAQYNIDFMTASVLRFVDKTGKNLYVAGDELILGEEDCFVQTNRRPGEKKECWRFEKASTLLKNSYEATISYCKTAMEGVHQERKKNLVDTLYTTIYDLDRSTVNLYYFYNYVDEVVFDLKKELKNGDRILNIPDMFPNNEPGKKYYTEYNKVNDMIKNLGGPQMTDRDKGYADLKNAISNSFIWEGAFTYKIFHMAQYYLQEKIDFERAILLLKLNVEILAKDGKAYADLGRAYMMNKQFALALENYEHAVALKPDDAQSEEQVTVLKKLIAEKEVSSKSPGIR
jgi:tetratricopeptide (TPR) repeat protein